MPIPDIKLCEIRNAVHAQQCGGSGECAASTPQLIWVDRVFFQGPRALLQLLQYAAHAVPGKNLGLAVPECLTWEEGFKSKYGAGSLLDRSIKTGCADRASPVGDHFHLL